MKWDFLVGNPPYQAETVEHVSETNGQAPRKNVFHYFQMEADKISENGSILIYPGGRWIHQSGKGLQQFGKEQINDPTLSAIEFYPDAHEVFGQAADLSDGVTIVLKEKNKKSLGFQYSYVKGGTRETVHADNPGDDLMPLNPKDISICKKIKQFVESKSLAFLHDGILPRSLFGIESDFVSKNKDLVTPLEQVTTVDFNKYVKLFTNDKAGKAGRAKWYVTKKEYIPNGKDFINKWKVVVSSANAGGQKRDNQIAIVDNHSAFGRSRVALRAFDTEKEAENFFNYAKSVLIRFSFLMTDEALTSLGKMVPDVVDYSDSNSYINYSKDIDSQLFSLFSMSEDEIAYMKRRVENPRNKEMA